MADDNNDDVNNDGASPEEKPTSRLRRMQEWWYNEFRRIVGAWVFVVVLLVMGAFFVAVVDFTDYIFSHNTFCGNVCHVMESTVYEELQESEHWKTETGVQATCADCHVDGRLTFAMVDHFIGTGELFTWLTNDFSKPGSFEKFRPAGANRERFKLLENDSKGCRSCHVMEAIQPKRNAGKSEHQLAQEEGITCIVCHYNLVHKPVEPSEEFQNTIDAILAEASGEEPEADDDAGEGDMLSPDFSDDFEGDDVL